jgi:hypothetical protein
MSSKQNNRRSYENTEAMSTTHPTYPNETRMILRSRMQIDLVIFSLVEDLESIREEDIPDDALREIGVPTITTLIHTASQALEQKPRLALSTLSDLMDPINCYAGFYEHEGWLDLADRLRGCWNALDELLGGPSSYAKHDPWIDVSAAVRSRQAEAA